MTTHDCTTTPEALCVSAERFCDAALATWDRDQIEETARRGLSEVDEAILDDEAALHGDDPGVAQRQVERALRAWVLIHPRV